MLKSNEQEESKSTCKGSDIPILESFLLKKFSIKG
jgi:hypothetical protein